MKREILFAYAMHRLQFSQLMGVYEEGNTENGRDFYPNVSPAEQLLLAQQDFYAFLQEFFRLPGSFCAVLAEDGVYAAALRIEPYRDGLLLQGVETKPAYRKMGLATQLLLATASHIKENCPGKLYSHVHKRNLASLALHRKCGFEKLLDYAVYADGSVLQNCCTMYIDL